MATLPRQHSSDIPTLGLTKHTPPDVAQMDIKAQDCDVVDWEGDILAIGVFEDSLSQDFHGDFNNSHLAALNSSLDGVLNDLVYEDEFKGLCGQFSTIRLSHAKVKRIALVGLGRSYAALDAVYASDSWRVLGSTAARLAKQSKLCSLGVALVDTDLMTEESKIAAVEAIASGAILGTYEDTRFKSEARPSMLKSVAMLSLGTGSERDEALRRAVGITAGVIIAKQLVAAPANVLTPGSLADAASSIAMAHRDVLSIIILEKDDCEALAMGAFLAVANGSEMPPKFIHMKYTPPGGIVYKRIAVVGKGICFESGGYNIKSGVGSELELMKYDMGGSGAALGAASAIGALKPMGVEVHFICAACENMISGKALHPGDIVTAANGKTIEVINTDAEGRLSLADSLVYACGLHVDAILDVATLTGACIVALGHDVGGLFTPSESMAEQLFTAARVAGEKLWRLPLVERYRESLNSSIADVTNSTGNDGSSIKAALFLKEFITMGTEWAHLDITGPVWNRSSGTASGYPVRTLVKWVMGLSQ